VVRAKRKKKEADRQLSEFKSEMRRFLGEAAGKTTDEVNQKLVKPVETVLVSTHKMLQDKKEELIQYSEGNATSCAELERKKQECIGLYDDIYRT